MKCGSPRVIPKARTIDRDDGARRNQWIAVEQDPGALLLKETVYADLHARICCSCGFVELFTEKLDELWQAHLVARERNQ